MMQVVAPYVYNICLFVRAKFMVVSRVIDKNIQSYIHCVWLGRWTNPLIPQGIIIRFVSWGFAFQCPSLVRDIRLVSLVCVHRPSKPIYAWLHDHIHKERPERISKEGQRGPQCITWNSLVVVAHTARWRWLR
jgi:hypothetical protein